VTFGPHRLMFRPRDSHDLRLVSTGILIEPEASIRWIHDVFGNSIAIASFESPADRLVFESTIVVEQYGTVDVDYPVEPYARTYPFSYPSEEIPDIGRTIERHVADPEHAVDTWAKRFVAEAPQIDGSPSTMGILGEMTRAINREIYYERRYALGTRSPVETLALQSGTCRDMALLMMEAARSLGFAARFVTGYLYDPALDGADDGIVGAGDTHAWVSLYLPGAGWVEFDPTNGLIGGPNLIRVAVARDPGQALPLTGSYFGPAEAFQGMSVDVEVRSG
jgi:transglutaminase-like putative cysteine protease